MKLSLAVVYAGYEQGFAIEVALTAHEAVGQELAIAFAMVIREVVLRLP